MLDVELKEHLIHSIIPFWKELRDEEFGGFYGYLDYNLKLNKRAEKGLILNSRILWFFSSAYKELKEDDLLRYAKHAYEFLNDHGLDQENGGVYWSLTYDGAVLDSTKHTYNQAFAIYALSAYYEVTGKEEALQKALAIYELIENKCKDSFGYLEAFDPYFNPIQNDKLSDNGVIAHKTMNTLLHILEAYTQLYYVSKDERIKKNIKEIFDKIEGKVFHPIKKRQEVFFDDKMNSILDIHSYGHDIEASWLIDRGLEVINDPVYSKKMGKITSTLVEEVYSKAYEEHSLANECASGKIDTKRIWWVQAEAIVGLYNAYEKEKKQEYLLAVQAIWDFIKSYFIDKRAGSEWLHAVDIQGKAIEGLPIVEPWKCPYHNGRMCLEIIRRMKDASC